MAVYTYSLTYADVVAELPGIDSGSVTATTEPLSTSTINQYIEDGAAKLNSVLIARGITPAADMGETDHAALVGAVKSYAVSKCLYVLGAVGDSYEQANERWLTVYAEYSNRPQQLGESYASPTTTIIDEVVETNGVISHVDHGTESWSFIGFENNKW